MGDGVDVWVRDDNKITLTAPSTAIVFIVVGIRVLVGLSAMSFFALRFNLRKVNEKLAAV